MCFIERWVLFAIREEGHDFCGCAAGVEKGGHLLHVGINVGEEAFVRGAEIVETVLAVGRLDETVFWAFAVAGKTHVALAAVFGKG